MGSVQACDARAKRPQCTGNITAPHFFGGLIKTGFSFDKFVDGDLRPFAAGTPSDVKERFDLKLLQPVAPTTKSHSVVAPDYLKGEGS